MAMTGERASEPVRAVADQVNARIASAMKGFFPAQVVQLKKGENKLVVPRPTRWASAGLRRTVCNRRKPRGMQRR